MKNIDICYGEYAAKWGLADFYPESEAKLREALDSGENFDTYYGCKKEIRYCRITRDEKSVTVSVESCMDDLYESDELIYDALWARLHTEEELPDETIEAITDHCYDLNLCDRGEAVTILPREATFEEIVNAIKANESESEELNSVTFKTVCDIVESYYKELRG